MPEVKASDCSKPTQLVHWRGQGGEAHLGSVQLALGVWKAQASSIALDLFCHLILQEQTANYQQQGPVSSQLPRLSRVAAMAVPRAMETA